MHNKFLATLTSLAFTRRTADTPSVDAPVELAAADLHLVGGGLAPRGGWQSTSDSTLTTTDSTVQAPRGGW